MSPREPRDRRPAWNAVAAAPPFCFAKLTARNAQAANYLNIKTLLDLTCKTVADMIKGKTPEEIRAHFNIQNDFTCVSQTPSIPALAARIPCSPSPALPAGDDDPLTHVRLSWGEQVLTVFACLLFAQPGGGRGGPPRERLVRGHLNVDGPRKGTALEGRETTASFGAMLPALAL